jgi:hypothetical protein
MLAIHVIAPVMVLAVHVVVLARHVMVMPVAGWLGRCLTDRREREQPRDCGNGEHLGASCRAACEQAAGSGRHEALVGGRMR